MKSQLFLSILLAVLAGCAAPRSVLHSGKVTEKFHFRAGAGASGNISTATTSALFGGIENTIKAVLNDTAIAVDQSTQNMTKAVISYSLDPLTLSPDFYLRFGIWNRVDIGFKLAGGVKIFDFMVQFLGPLPNDSNTTASRWYGSTGAQYSGQDYTLPSYLGDLQELLGYEMKRKDILVPLVFSREFGPREKFGAFGTGLLYNYSMIKYKYEPTVFFYLAESVDERVAKVPQQETGFSSFGSFVNLKAGYRFAYIILSLSAFYQNYGEFQLLAGESVSLSGITFVPAAGIQLVF